MRDKLLTMRGLKPPDTEGLRVCTLFYRNVPADLRDLFKAACYRRGEKMRSITLRLMRFYIKHVQNLQTRGRKPRGPKRKKVVI